MRSDITILASSTISSTQRDQAAHLVLQVLNYTFQGPRFPQYTRTLSRCVRSLEGNIETGCVARSARSRVAKDGGVWEEERRDDRALVPKRAHRRGRR